MTELLYIINFIEKNIYDNTVEKYFKKLIINDKNILKKYYKKLLIIIYYSFFENNTNLEVFKEKMSLNNYSDASAILLLLLPFINSNENTNNIISFNDLVTKKHKNIDIKTESPKYVYTNFQYNRCNRSSITEIDYNEEYLRHNYQFLAKTISHMSNKLYINWVDVIPHNIIDYRNEKLYKNTKEQFDNGELRDYDFYDNSDNNEVNDNLIRNLQSLTIADIYETVTNEFYYQIKKVKWLIYDIKVENRNGPIPIILILNQIFGDILSDTILVDWINLPESVSKKMDENWSLLINLAKSNNNFDNGIISITSKNVKKILISIVIFFNNHYKDIENLVDRKKYEMINFEIDDDTLENNLDDDEDKIISKLKFSKILNVLKYIKTEYFYTFIKDSLDIMKLTWYSLVLLQKNKNFINTISYYETKFQYDDKFKITKITMKNIYNFSKSFCHIKYNDQFTPLPRYWESLNLEQRKIIEDRLYDTTQNVLDWFNISRNLKSLHIKNFQEYNKQLYEHIKTNLIDYVFESFISRGILSKLIPNNEISDKTKISSDLRSKLVPAELNKTIFKIDPSNKLWTDSYYFLTSTTYEHMDLVRYKQTKDKIKIDKISTYFEFNGSLDGRAWYFAYALDWISQINFYNKFINNRIIYVTGATGVGKSTQVPKLLLYSQKAILYNSTSKIVCTQPRKTPTMKNAEIVSLEMGVPIGDKILEKYYLQFKHKDDKHIKNTVHLSLKFITDGSIAMEIQNPILKKEIVSQTPKSPYFTNNLYDIVIVDEAHEHNANMDIILTLMKYISLYNNTVKLVIVSATMDDDEPIYRRYYRDINDNKMFPLNYNIKNNNLDRINVDRRLHISPPGQTTRFKITDTFIEDIPLNLRDPVSIARNLINTTKDGDILIFQPGTGEIEKVITELNKPGYLPDSVIAVPYHSLLKTKQREIIENISKEKSSLSILKTQNFNETENLQIGPNTGMYQRVIIVATNIAEASITIDTLKYVIETGTQKTAIYDYSKRNTKLALKTISDSSRLQRRGRIGRVGPGDVYYLYEKGKTDSIKTIYNICIQDIGLDLYRRLYSNSSEKILLSNNNDPNNPKNKFELMQLESIYGKFFKNFESYFNLDVYYDYFGNDAHYDYENYKNNTYYHENGYSSYNLNDYTGEFYVIHPEEIDLTRNIIGTIINTKAKGTILKNNLLESTKINIFWETLRDTYFLDVIDKNIIKSDLGIKFQKLQEIFEFEDPKLFKIFLYSYVFDVTEDIIRLISILQLMTKFSDTFLTSIKVNGKMMKSIGHATKLLGITSRGDLEGIMILLEYFHNYLDKIDLKYDNNLDSTKKTLITEISRDLASKSKEQFTKTLTDLKVKIKDKIFLDSFNYLTDDNYAELRKSNAIVSYLEEEFNSKQHNIDNICDKLFLNKETMKKYFKKYSQIKNTLFTYMNKNMNETSIKSKDFELLEELTDILKKTIVNTKVNTNLDKYEKILTCFMMADSYNIVTNISGTQSYLYLYEPTIENIYQISTITQNTKNLDSFTNKFYLSNLLYFQKLDIDKESISVINYIHPKLMENLYKIYNLNLLNDKIADLMKKIYIKVSTKNQVVSTDYFSELKELEKNLKENTQIYISKEADIEKINIFNKKIKEIMQ
jgi:hypothetical protein